jgi:hypothetical protein
MNECNFRQAGFCIGVKWQEHPARLGFNCWEMRQSKLFLWGLGVLVLGPILASKQTDSTKRFRRLNHDTLEMQIIIDDPKPNAKVWVSPPKRHRLNPGWEIAE